MQFPWYDRKRSTEDDFDATTAINYLGHYLLLDKIKNSAPSRILVVTSLSLDMQEFEY